MFYHFHKNQNRNENKFNQLNWIQFLKLSILKEAKLLVLIGIKMFPQNSLKTTLLNFPFPQSSFT